jgi:HEAT repeat protein
MYVCDWRGNPAQPSQQPDGKQGRILRLRWAGTKEQPAPAPRGLDRWAKLTTQPVEELIELLRSEARGDRLRAQQELARRGGDDIRKTLLELVENAESTVQRVAALGALNSLWNRDVKLACLRIMEGAGSPDMRRLAAEALALNGNPGDIEVHAALLRALGDQHLGARRAIALAMGQIGNPDAADALAAAFKFNRDNDPYLADGYLRAIERLGKPGIDKLIELALSGDPKDFDRVIETFLALRTRAAADAIPELLKYPHITVPQRARLLGTYRHFLTEPPVSLTPVADFLLSRPDEPAPVKVAGLQTLALGGQLKGERLENLAIGLLDEPDPELRRQVVELIELAGLKQPAPKKQ